MPSINPSNQSRTIIMNDAELLSTMGLEVRTKCEIWTRVMGYHRPIEAWNPGKKQEHRDRCYFQEQHGA